MLKEMLITHRAKYMKNIRYRHIQSLLGQGLLLSEAADWRRQRVITQPAFKPEAIDNSVGWMAEHVDHFLHRWDGYADRGEIFDVEPEFNRLAQLLSGRYLLGEPFADIADEFCEVAAAVKKHWPQAPRNIVRAFIPHSKELIARFDAAIAALDACILGFIKRHRATDFEGCGVLKRIVTTSRAEGNEFDDKSLRDQLSTLFFAGHETSATGLCWIHWALSRHPAIPRADAGRSHAGAGRPARHRRRRAQPAVHRPGHRRIAAPAFADPLHLARRDGRQHRRRLSHSGRRHRGRFHVRHPPAGAPLSESRSVRSRALRARGRSPRVIASPTCRLRPAIATASAPARRWWSSSSSSRASRSASNSISRRVTRSNRPRAPPCFRATA